MKKILAVLSSIALALTVAIAPSPSCAAEKSVIDGVLERGVLRVGFSSFVPWAMQDKAGNFIGFEIDVATRLANDLGVKLQLVPTRWDGIIPALLSGKFDVIIGGMSVTTERSLQVNFTVPYDTQVIDIAVHKENGANIKTLEDLNKPEMVIASRTGSTASIAAKKLLPNATHRLFNDEAPAVQEVLSGRAVAFISGAPLPAFETLKNSDKLIQPFTISIYQQPVSFAVPKGDIDTLNVFDNWIRQVEAEGWLQDRRDYWFKNNSWEKDM